MPRRGDRLPRTERKDRREKLAAYRRMLDLRAYLIVGQGRRWVKRHLRNEVGVGRRADLVDEGELSIPWPETKLRLAELYGPGAGIRL